MKASIRLQIVIFGLTKALIREHFFVNTPLTWNKAQSYCRAYYEDLSIITSEEEQSLILGLTETTGLKWIGLHREMTSNSNWLWPDGKSLSFTNWAQNQPDNLDGNQFCVAIINKWFDFNCDSTRPIFCSKTRYILVKEKRTWEEALLYCRSNYNDLASMTTDRQLQLAKNKTMNPQTESVWTGLRYLLGEWFWVNNETLQDQIPLPECPDQPYRCGARNTESDKWENRNCGERLNFLCN